MSALRRCREGHPSRAFPTANGTQIIDCQVAHHPEEPREVDQLPLLEPISEYNVALGDFAVGNILTQKRVRNRAVEHVCKRAGRTNQRKAREPFHKSVCAGVQWINSRTVARMMSFWDFENSLKDSEGGDFSRRAAAGTTRWRRRLRSSGQLGRVSNRQFGGVMFLVAYRDVWCFFYCAGFESAPRLIGFLATDNLLVCVVRLHGGYLFFFLLR